MLSVHPVASPSCGQLSPDSSEDVRQVIGAAAMH